MTGVSKDFVLFCTLNYVFALACCVTSMASPLMAAMGGSVSKKYQRDFTQSQQTKAWPSQTGLQRGVRKAIKDVHKHWPNGVIPYRFDRNGEFSEEERLIILAAMTIWSIDTCITFRPAIRSDEDFVTFTGGNYCRSYIGRKGGEQFVVLDKLGCRDLKTVIHEIGHAVGLFHEQSRPDRDEYVEIVWDNIKEDYRHNFEKKPNIETHGTPYDVKSTMHYANDDFSAQIGLPTINSLHTSGKQMGRNVDVSFYDVRVVSLMYKCYQKCGVHIPELACREGTYAFMGRDCHCYSLETYRSNLIIV